MLALLHFPVQSGMSLIEALLFPPLFSFVLFTRSNQLKGKFAVRSGSYEKIFGVPK